MSDSTRDLLVYGIAAAKANSKAEARHYLEWLLRDGTATQDETVEAWRWIAKISDDPKEKRDSLEQVLACNPMDPEARRTLAILNGDLNPADIVDADHLPTRDASQAPRPIEARRFVCANCGGRMSYSADNASLTCDYCGRRQSLASAMSNGSMLEEHDFAVALATAKGHSRPVTTQSIKCTGCGASFVLSPEIISKCCPYCGSAYVIEQIETRELIAPKGIVPFAISRDRAQRAVLEWYRSEEFKVLSADALPSGVYLPAWTFDIGGVIEWHCEIEIGDAWLPQTGSYLVGENDIHIVASHTLSAQLTREMETSLIDRLVPYDPGYLADWPAETYQVTLGDASLVARTRALAHARPRIEASVAHNHRNLHLSTLKLVTESYKLILLPFWIARYHLQEKWYSIAIDGQSGEIRAEKPHQGVLGWFENLMSAE